MPSRPEPPEPPKMGTAGTHVLPLLSVMGVAPNDPVQTWKIATSRLPGVLVNAGDARLAADAWLNTRLTTGGSMGQYVVTAPGADTSGVKYAHTAAAPTEPVHDQVGLAATGTVWI